MHIKKVVNGVIKTSLAAPSLTGVVVLVLGVVLSVLTYPPFSVVVDEEEESSSTNSKKF